MKEIQRKKSHVPNSQSEYNGSMTLPSESKEKRIAMSNQAKVYPSLSRSTTIEIISLSASALNTSRSATECDRIPNNTSQTTPQKPHDTEENMSREAYQVPTAVPNPGRDSFGGGLAVEGPAILYTCGDCSAKVPLKRGDPIRCKECGHRVLYKERTKR